MSYRAPPGLVLFLYLIHYSKYTQKKKLHNFLVLKAESEDDAAYTTKEGFLKLMENKVRRRVLAILMENKNPFFGPYCRTQISAPALVHRGLVLFLAQDLYRLSVAQARISGVGRDIRFRPRRLEALFELLTRADWPGTVRKRRRPPGPCLTVHPPRGLVSQSPALRTHKVSRVPWSVLPTRSFVVSPALVAAAVVCEPFVIRLTRRPGISIAAAFWPKR